MRIPLASIAILSFFFSTAFAQRPGGNPFAGISKGLGLFSSSQGSLSYSGFRAHKDEGKTDQHRFNASYPLYKSELESYTLSLGANELHFAELATLSKTGASVPRTFQKYDLNLGYNRNLAPGKFAGVRGSIGVASDKPFRDPGDTTYNLIGFYAYPGEEQSLWVLTAFMSNNSPILNYIPFPGFFYMSKSDDFVYILGIPLASIIWTPMEKFKVSASAFGPLLNIEASNGMTDKSEVAAGFSWGPQTFIRHDREKRDYRIYYVEKKLTLSYRFNFSEGFNTEFQIGRTFDREIYEGKKYGESQGGKADLESSPFLGINLNASF